MTETAQAEQKIISALEVQGIPDRPVLKERVRELLARNAFETVMGWVFSNQAVFTSTTSPVPAPTWLPAPEWTVSAPQSSPVSMETSVAAKIEPPQEPGRAPLSDADIQVDVDVYRLLSEPEQAEIRHKLDADKGLARLTGQMLFGQAQEQSFICPRCRSKSPGAECKEFMRKVLFKCGACGMRGSLYQFEAARNGRKTASAEDFQVVEAVAFSAYSS